MKWLIDDARNWWRFWSVRINMICATLSGLMFFDLPAILNGWNMMPPAVRALIPGNVAEKMGLVLFILTMVSMLARVAPQAKLEAQRENRVSANAD